MGPATTRATVLAASTVAAGAMVLTALAVSAAQRGAQTPSTSTVSQIVVPGSSSNSSPGRTGDGAVAPDGPPARGKPGEQQKAPEKSRADETNQADEKSKAEQSLEREGDGEGASEKAPGAHDRTGNRSEG